MKSSFRAMRLFVVAAGLFLVVGAASMATAGSQAKVTINVAALRPGSSEDAQKQFNDNVALFERQHPNIDVKAVEYAWNGATFAAQLAAGRLPTVFTVPFTDARTLGEHRQVADLTAGVKRWPYFDKFQKTIIAEATTSRAGSSAFLTPCMRRPFTTTVRSSGRRVSIRTSRRRHGRSSGSMRSRSRTGPGRLGTRRWVSTTTRPAGS